MNIRLPRNIVAALVGGLSSCIWCNFASSYENPLADPQIVGVSSGAGLAECYHIYFIPGYDLYSSVGSFLGAMAAHSWCMHTSMENGVRPSRIILAGVLRSQPF